VRALVVSIVLVASAAAADPPAPRATSHVIVKGDTLDAIAAAAYGSRHYSRVLEVVDHVDPATLRVGATLALPSFADVAAPLAKRVPDGAAALVRAQATWRAVAESLWDEHRKTDAVKPRREVASAAADAATALAAFKKAGAPTGQLRSLVATLDAIADGHLDPDGYELDEADRRFAYALTALLGWAG
jgi:hypothetical protein